MRGSRFKVFIHLERPEEIAVLKSETLELVDVGDGHDAVDLTVLVFGVVGAHVGFWVKQSQASANVSGK